MTPTKTPPSAHTDLAELAVWEGLSGVGLGAALDAVDKILDFWLVKELTRDEVEGFSELSEDGATDDGEETTVGVNDLYQVFIKAVLKKKLDLR